MAAQGEGLPPPPGAFPLLVRGPWGSAEPPGALRKKLLCYFQSQKRSGGGECELRAGPAPGSLLLCFARRDVRQRVLDRRSHELDWGPGGRLALLVTEPPAGGDAAQVRRAAVAGREVAAAAGAPNASPVLVLSGGRSGERGPGSR
uniref:PAR14-like first RRM domain-containing protein n=1 Tax=Nothoprocta perdicaria TaxID=30464 RepID=A0A8C6ZNN5_NOTPE